MTATTLEAPEQIQPVKTEERQSEACVYLVAAVVFFLLLAFAIFGPNVR